MQYIIYNKLINDIQADYEKGWFSNTSFTTGLKSLPMGEDEEGQSTWSKRQQGFQPCCKAGIRELPFLMPEPAEEPSLHSYLHERYGSSTQKLY